MKSHSNQNNQIQIGTKAHNFLITGIYVAFCCSASLGSDFDRKVCMGELKASLAKLETYSSKDFKNSQKLNEVIKESDKIHVLSYGLMANDDDHRNDDEYLRLISHLIGYNRNLKNSALSSNYQKFNAARVLVEKTCIKCHNKYKIDNQ